MAFELPPLPYDLKALEPHISARTLEFHYGKHHAGYVKKLNGMIPGSEFEQSSLEDIIRKASGGIFNNAAQVFNHTFYWQCMSPDGGGEPSGAVADALKAEFGSVDKFREEFSEKAGGLFGSGWAWLVRKADGSLAITQTGNAGCPIASGDTPLLTCDVWEHAYYLDYQNARPEYIKAFWNLVNWDFVAQNLSG
ncbi:MAG: superoxide dismutase [Gammaproteobacteria bacterium]|nr:superoxide dismutase [Gammaproteobacteria bacterium]